MPGPHDPQALRALALTALDHAYSRRKAVHTLEMLRLRPEPNLAEGVLSQRRVLLQLAEGLVEKEFERDMTTLTQCWIEYKDALK